MCEASQPDAGALPPWVLTRWMLVARESTPLPSRLRIVTRSHGMELASGEGELATALPETRLPSFASQEGPAKCFRKDQKMETVCRTPFPPRRKPLFFP